MNEARNREMVRMHVGDLMTLRAIGQTFGLSGERVRQLIRLAGVTPGMSDVLRSQRTLLKIRTINCGCCDTVFSFMPKNGMRRQFCSRNCAFKAKRTRTDSEMLDHMKRLSVLLGCTPGKRDLDFHGPPCCMSYQKWFGSLRSAQIAAGLTPNKVGRPHKNQLIEP